MNFDNPSWDSLIRVLPAIKQQISTVEVFPGVSLAFLTEVRATMGRFLAPGAFMWMGKCSYNGAEIDLYKHKDRRSYLNVTADGKFYTYVAEGDGSYKEVAIIDAVGRFLK